MPRPIETSKSVRSGRRSAGVKVRLAALQLKAPATSGLIANACCAEAWSTGSEKSISMLLVVSAWCVSPARCWVSEMARMVGPLTSTVDA